MNKVYNKIKEFLENPIENMEDFYDRILKNN
ncbi:hypothetical protein NCTC15132_00660 [Fusobacterium sp. oral taxon C10]